MKTDDEKVKEEKEEQVNCELILGVRLGHNNDMSFCMFIVYSLWQSSQRELIYIIMKVLPMGI